MLHSHPSLRLPALVDKGILQGDARPVHPPEQVGLNGRRVRPVFQGSSAQTSRDAR